jgi:hypothetical protein
MARILILVPLALALAAGGCKKAPEPPEGELPGDVTLFQSFIADEELLRPVIQPMIDEGVDYIDSGETSCYRVADLLPCDAMSMCIEGIDPTGVPAVVHSEVMHYPVADVERALMQEDWTELFPSNYDEYEVVFEEGREEYLAGDAHYYLRQYQAVVPVLTMQASLVTNLQYRRIDDWDGEGNPLVLIRGWFPSMPETTSEQLVMTMNFSWEILEPVEGGTKTRRLFANWTDLTIGSLSAGEAFNIACMQSKAGWDDINDWLEAESS